MESRWRTTKRRKQPLGQRRKKVQRIKMIFFVIFAITILVLFGWILRLPNISLQEVSITGNDLTKEESIRELVDEKLAGSYMFVVPRNSSYFFPEEDIEETILNTFTRIERVQAKKTERTKLTVTITERDPFALWCDGERGTTTLESTVGQCYFVDDKSYIFAKAPRFSGNVFFTYFGDLYIEGESASSSLGGQFMEENEFSAYGVFVNSFEEFGFNPISLTRIDEKDFEVGLEVGGSIIFGNDTKLSVILDNLQSVVESPAFSEVEKDTLEYIDLRFGNRIYYKFVGEELTEN